MRIKVGERWIGTGEPCYVIAEAGSNHNGNLEQALALIDAAAESGADAVKFQGFRARTLYPRTAGTSDYLKDKRPIYDIIEAMELSPAWLPTLANHCTERNVHFLCTPFDEEWVELLDPYVPAFKLASYEMSHLPLARAVLSRGKPVFASTGAHTIDEVGPLIAVASEVGNTSLVVLQCTAAYPTPPHAVNARAIVTLREATGHLVGLSDHSRDPVIAPVVAVALGACVIEKHFTLSNRMPGPDQRFAVEPHELKRLVESVRQAEAVLGTGVKKVLAVEEELRQFALRSVFSVRAMRTGETFSADNLRVLRNGANAAGLPPSAYPRLLGRRAATDIPADVPLTLAMVAAGLSWRRAAMDDARLLWTWANDAETRRNAFSKAPIAYETHVVWLQRRLASETTRLLIFADAIGPVGQVRFDVAHDVAEVSIVVAPDRRGAGHGRAMLSEALSALRAEHGSRVRPRARVLAHNGRSLAMFRAGGFVSMGVERRDGEDVVVLELPGDTV